MDQNEANLLSLLNDVTDQVNSVFDLSQLTLTQNTAVVEQMLQPTYFNVYPIDWTQVPIVRFTEIPQ